jgi:hypothetical protein
MVTFFLLTFALRRDTLPSEHGRFEVVAPM